MKKFLSLIIAMLLIVSLSATTAVAFAEGETATFKVTYAVGEHGEGTVPEAKSYAANAEVTLASSSTFTPKKGYEFAGWLVEDQSDIIAAGKTFTMPAKDITVTAQWTPARELKLNEGVDLMSYLSKDKFFDELKWEMGDIKIGEDMMKDAEHNLQAIFDKIKYVDNDDSETGVKKADNDKIYVEYCRPSESPKGQETWQNSTLITNSIRLSSSGWYLFRIVVKDSSGKNVLYTSAKFSRYAEDTKNPVISLSSSMKDKVESGLTEGTKYSVSTSLTITDSSSTTVTYKIYKYVKGAWTTEPIYDSETKIVAEGYENFVSTDGTITPAKEDVSAEPVYRIVYSVVDSNGFVGVESDDKTEEYNPKMELFVNAAPVEKNKVNVLEIVLFSIAGVAFIGIIVLLFIKPKEPVAEYKTVAKSDEIVEDEETEQQ